MKFEVRLTDEAAADLRRLFNHLVDQAAGDWRPAEEALEAIRAALVFLEASPFACRRVANPDRHLRELLIGFGATGYVALIEIGRGGTVTVAAVRHQREGDYR